MTQAVFSRRAGSGLTMVLLLATLGSPAVAIAQRTADPPARAPLADSSRDRAWFGFTYHPAIEARDGALEIRVLGVVAGSPADRAGLRAGDRLIRFDSRPITTSRLEGLQDRLSPGDTLRVRVIRESRERDVVMVAGARRAMLWTTGAGTPVVVEPDSIRRMVVVYMDSVRSQMRRIDAGVIRLQEVRLHADSLSRELRIREGAALRLDTAHARRAGDPAAGWPALAAAAEAHAARMAEANVSRLERGVPVALAPVLMGTRAVAGAEFTEMNPGLEEYFQVGHGLLVLKVPEETPAHRSGLRAGDVVVRIAGRDAQRISELRAAIAASGSEGVALDVVRKARRLTLQLRSR